MKKVFTFVVVALFAMTVNAQENRVFKYCVPADFDLTDFHKVIEAKDENGELMGTIEMLSSPTKDKLFPFIKDENGEPILDSEGKPQFDEEHPNPAWSYKVNNPEGNMSLTGLEEGFGYCIIGQGNPVMSQEEGWAYNEDKGAWYWKVGNYVFWTPGCGELPKQGEYVKVTPTADGVISIGTFINKGGGVNGTGHQLYIIDESTKDAGYTVLGSDKVEITGYFNNNTWIPDAVKQVYSEAEGKWVNAQDENGENIKYYPFGETLPLNLKLSDDYSLFCYTAQDEGVVKRMDRVFLGIVKFQVQKNVTYWMMNPTSQIGFYGFKLEIGASMTSINTVKTSADTNSAFYNMAGQKVSKDYKGLVIQNGRKVLKK